MQKILTPFRKRRISNGEIPRTTVRAHALPKFTSIVEYDVALPEHAFPTRWRVATANTVQPCSPCTRRVQFFMSTCEGQTGRLT